MNSYFLSGQKVKLRGLRKEDLEAYRRWLDDPDVTYFMEMGWRPASDRDLEALYREATDGHSAVVFVIEDAETADALGTAGLYLIQWPCRRAQYRIHIGEPSAWNKGLCSEVTGLIVTYGFDRLNLETIYLGTNAENPAAIRCYEKAGFSTEGRQRKFIYRDGRYYDVVNMSVLREEFLAKREEAG